MKTNGTTCKILTNRQHQFGSNDSGTTSIEYGVIAAMGGLALLTLTQFIDLGGKMNNTFAQVSGGLTQTVEKTIATTKKIQGQVRN